MNVQAPRCLIAGCGDLGRRVARELVPLGYRVHGLSRHRVDDSNLAWIEGDLTRPESLQAMPDALDAIVFCPSPDRRDEAAYRALYLGGLQHLVAALDGRLKPFARFVFVSSTSTYGEMHGAWVDEETPAEPDAFNGRVLREAEDWLARQPFDHVVLRLAGLYGPGREGMVRAAAASSDAGSRSHWTNRIHIDDAARAAAHLLQLPDVESCYLGVDDLPVLRAEVLHWLATRAGGEDAASGSALPDAATHGKRVSNRRLRLTGFNLLYPDYRAGYAALVTASGGA